MRNFKVLSIQLRNHFKLALDQCPKTDVKTKYMSNVSYASVVGCLVNVMVCTRPYLNKL